MALSPNLVLRRLYSGISKKVRSQKYVLNKYFQGEPKMSDFKIVEEDLPELGDGEILTEAEYLSVDPYMRAYMIGYKLPTDMIGGQVAKVIDSKNKNIPVGTYVCGSFGWRTHTITNGQVNNTFDLPITVLPDLSPYPVSLALGLLGMPGNTAYFGLKEICQPKEGETIVITGAAGAVGSHVGQIGKILAVTDHLGGTALSVPRLYSVWLTYHGRNEEILNSQIELSNNNGCRVIGFAGTDEKCEYLEKELGFDRAFNYKTCNIRAALKDGAPNRVDCYFDNVGGEISSTIMSYMNKYGRVAVCGSISSYNDTAPPKVTIVQPALVFKELKMEGFLVNRWTNRWQEGIDMNLKWLKEGKLKYQEKIYHGFENMVDALVGILRGENTGKAVVKVK